MSTTFEEEQAERLRRRVRPVLAFGLAIWTFSFLFADSFLYGSRLGKVETRVFELVWASGVLYWLRRPRPLAKIEASLIVGVGVLMVLSAASLLRLHEDHLDFAMVTRLLGVYFATYASQLRWRASLASNGLTALTMLAGYLLAQPDQGLYRLWLASMWVITPVPVFAYAAHRRERDQRREHALRRELEEANARLANEMQTRTRLFLGLNHDLRTPLAVIRAESEAMAAQTPEERVKASALRIAASTGYAADLVDQLLELARLETRTAWGAPIPHRVDELIHGLIAQLQPARGARLHVDAEPVVAKADPSHVRRIVINLVTNALRCVAPDGNIYVRVRGGVDRVIVDVRDDGPGIPEPLRARLFERFATMEAGSVVSGIGLPLARELAELNGGSLELCEASPAHFTLTLPSSKATPHLVQPEVAGLLPLDSPLPIGAADDTSAKPRVLVVEDHPQLSELLVAQLQPDYAVVAVGTLAAAREALSGPAPHLILSDVMLPDGRGPALLEVLRERFGPDAPPFLLLSALGDPEARVEGLRAGADDYIVKPFSAGELRARIERALRRSTERELYLERQRDALMMELHDGVGGSLARASVALGSADLAKIDAARAELDEGLLELRGALRQLERGDIAWAELAAEVRLTTAEAAEGAGLDFESEIDFTSAVEVPAALSHALRRLVREATTNAIRHAQATRLGLSLRAIDGSLHALLWDDGRGIGDRAPGRGIGAMQRRAARLSGEIHVEDRPAGGTQVRICLPLASSRVNESQAPGRVYLESG